MVGLPIISLFRQWSHVRLLAMERALHGCAPKQHRNEVHSLSDLCLQSIRLFGLPRTPLRCLLVPPPHHSTPAVDLPSLCSRSQSRPVSRSLFCRAGDFWRTPDEGFCLMAAHGSHTRPLPTVLEMPRRNLLQLFHQTAGGPSLKPQKATSLSFLKS
jgi:hypothetical protein